MLRRCSPSAAATPTGGQEGPARLPALARRASRRAVLAQPVRAGAARLAHRVQRDRAGPPRSGLRRPGRRQRPGLPAPRDERRRTPRRPPGRAVRPGLRPRRDGRPTTARRCRSPRATWSSCPRCARAGSTRWRSGSRCCATTTATTGSGPTTRSGTPSTRSRTGARALAAGAGADRRRRRRAVLAALADDLDAPRRRAAVQDWVDATLADAGDDHRPRRPARCMRDLLDAALGLALA